VAGQEGRLLNQKFVYRLLLAVAHNHHVQYFSVFCIVGGTYTTIGLVIAWCEGRTVAS